MRTFHATATIAATRAAVWEILADLARWPDWNPTVESVEGEVALGEKITLRTAANPGRAFPLEVTESRGVAFAAGREKVRQSIWLILSTAPGERQMQPEFGSGIHDLVFQPNTSVLRGQVREKVLKALIEFEPRIDVIDVKVESQPQTANRIDISIDYRLRTNNAFFNIVYPFFLNEGPNSL